MQSTEPILLTTKRYRPRRRATCVARPRLRQMLERGLTDGWVLVVAAAGSGKTTLVVDWTEPYVDRTCWLSLDEEDDEPTRFFAYLLAAIEEREPELMPDVSARLQVTHRETFDDVVAALLNCLAQLEERLIIVLDDYHRIENEQINAAMTRMVAHASPLATFVLITRKDPPLPIARMRVIGELTEVRAHDLAFTLDEATRFFNESFGLNLTSDQVEALSARTEGWSAGMQMAALALQSKRQNNASFIDNFTGSHRHVLDYLMEEVLRSQPESVRNFMMQTAPLRQFNVALCNAAMDESSENNGISSAKNAAVMLDYLETHNLFLVPLDDSRQWYRYHHLFADLLRSELDKVRPDATRQIQHRAAAWFETEGNYEEAISYASDAGAFEHTAMLMQKHLMTSYWQIPLQTWRSWYRRLPAEFFAVNAHLGFLFGHALLIRGFVDDALTLLRQLDPMELEIDNRLMYEYMNIYERHTVESYAALLEDIDPRTLSPIGNLMYASLISARGDHLRACAMVDEAAQQALRTGDPIAIIGLGPHRCRLYSLAGRLQEARAMSEELLAQAAAAPHGPTEMFSFLYMVIGRSLLAQNQLEEAEVILRQGQQFVEETGFLMSVLPMETMLLAEVKMAQGDEEGARAEAQSAVELSRRHELSGESEWLQSYQIQILLRQGDLTAATEWLQERRELPMARFSPSTCRRIVEAQIYLAQNRPSRAINLLTELTQEPQNLHTVDAWLLLALARQAAGDGQHAIIALTTAISFAEPETNIRAFLNQADLHAKLLVRLLNRFAEENPENRFVQTLISLLPATEEEATAQSNLIEPLSDRELEVLNLIVAGHANKEIAAQMILAPNTIKWYIKVLYGKLHVKSRSQAIARAHELRLTG